MIENFKLRVFRVVAGNLNYRRAAYELHITLPAITAQIRSLEESLRIALFDRVGRETSLTLAGTTLLRYVRTKRGSSPHETVFSCSGNMIGQAY